MSIISKLGITKLQALIVLASLLLLVTVANTLGQNIKQHYKNEVVDLSWPNCKTLSQTIYSSGIIGVTGGLDFHANPCLAQEVPLIIKVSLYLNSGYPGPKYRSNQQNSPHICSKENDVCHAYNYGYNAALYAIKYADIKNAHARLWWIDVENDNSWTNSSIVNRAEISGSLDAIKNNIFLAKVGVYSYPGQWNLLTGNWRNLLPAWVATGQYSQSVALKACKSRSFTSGPLWLSQYTDKIDINLICSGAVSSLI